MLTDPRNTYTAASDFAHRHFLRVVRSGLRQLSECVHLAPATTCIDCAAGLALPCLRHSDPHKGQRSAPELAVAARTLS